MTHTGHPQCAFCFRVWPLHYKHSNKKFMLYWAIQTLTIFQIIINARCFVFRFFNQCNWMLTGHTSHTFYIVIKSDRITSKHTVSEGLKDDSFFPFFYFYIQIQYLPRLVFNISLHITWKLKPCVRELNRNNLLHASSIGIKKKKPQTITRFYSVTYVGALRVTGSFDYFKIIFWERVET